MTTKPKPETPEEFRRKLDGMDGIFWSTGQREKIEECIVTRDAAIRAESATLLKMCGEALEQIASDDYMFSIHEIARVALAALGEAGVKV